MLRAKITLFLLTFFLFSCCMYAQKTYPATNKCVFIQYQKQIEFKYQIIGNLKSYKTLAEIIEAGRKMGADVVTDMERNNIGDYSAIAIRYNRTSDGGIIPIEEPQNLSQAKFSENYYPPSAECFYISKELIIYQYKSIAGVTSKISIADLLKKAKDCGADVITNLEMNKGILTADCLRYKRDPSGNHIKK